MIPTVTPRHGVTERPQGRPRAYPPADCETSQHRHRYPSRQPAPLGGIAGFLPGWPPVLGWQFVLGFEIGLETVTPANQGVQFALNDSE